MAEFYSDQRKIELRVGIIVIISLVILVIGYAWLKNYIQLNSMSEIKIKFANAQGLEIGDKISVNGMEAGRVTNLTQLPDGVLVQSKLRLKFPIRKGARFIIQDSNLMGGKQVEIINSEQGEPIDTKLIQIGENSFGMTSLLATASITMQQINILLQELNRPEGVISQINTAFGETKNTLGKVNTAIDDSRDNLNIVLKHISASAQQLNELIIQNKTNLTKAVNMTPDLIQKAQATLDSLQTASNTLQEAVNAMTKSEGTVSKLVKDDKLYQNLLSSSAKLDSLLIDIKKNPSRYFKVKVF
jgi:phospholipid/cholesterol/gamma-HCH transport system substrate-binding protein